MDRRPIEPRQNAGERAGLSTNLVGQDRHAKLAEAGRIAIGIDGEFTDLRLQSLQDVGKKRPAGEQAQAFVAPAHARRAAAGEELANRVWTEAVEAFADGLLTAQALYDVDDYKAFVLVQIEAAVRIYGQVIDATLH